jgi:hypothetical protein
MRRFGEDKPWENLGRTRRPHQAGKVLARRYREGRQGPPVAAQSLHQGVLSASERDLVGLELQGRDGAGPQGGLALLHHLLRVGEVAWARAMFL